MLTVYHGTNRRFTRFDASFLGLNTLDNASNDYAALSSLLGFWFNTGGRLDDVYDHIISCDIRLDNPCVIDSLETLFYWIQSQEKTSAELVETLKNYGYDGIMIDQDDEFGGTSYVVFDIDQIKIIN